MKSTALLALLVLSLAVNGLLLRRRFAPPATASAAGSASAASAARVPAMAATTPAPSSIVFSQELAAEIATLRASGMPPDLIRAWASARIDERNAAREQALRPPPRQKYWQASPENSLANKFALIDLKAEKSRLLDELLGYDPNRPENAPYRFLPTEKQAQVKRIAETFAAKIDAFRAATAVMTTATEQAELARLESARQQALGNLLTADDQQRLGLRLTLSRWEPPPPDAMGNQHVDPNQPVAEKLRRDLRYFDATESEFIALHAIESEFAEARRFGLEDSRLLNQRMAEKIRTALGEDRLARYQQTTGTEYTMVVDVVGRMGLPRTTADEIATLRDRALTESARIDDAAALDTEAKRAALSAFAAAERTRIQSALGADGAIAVRSFVNRWLQPMEQGNILSASPTGGINRRPVGTPSGGGRAPAVPPGK